MSQTAFERRVARLRAHVLAQELKKEAAKAKRIDLESLTVKELRELAQENGIEGYASMKKAELIAALEGGEADAEDAETTN